MANIDTLRYKNTDYTLGKVPDKTLSISDTPADAKAVGDALVNQLTAYPNVSTSGPIAHFEDGADSIPMKDVLVHIEPVQEGSGDPSPDNVRPITGWTAAKVTRCGKNLFPKSSQNSTKNGITIETVSDGVYHIYGTASAATTFSLGNRVFPRVQLKLSGTTNGSNAQIYINFQLNGVYVNRQVTVTGTRLTAMFTPDYIGYDSFTIGIFVGSGKTVDEYISPMLCLASDTDDTYEPYSGSTYTLTFPSSAGTVYGGFLHAASGVLTVTHKLYTFDGSENWTAGNYGFRYEFNLGGLPDYVKTYNSGGRGLSNLGIYDNTAYNTSDKNYITSRTSVGTSTTGARTHVLVIPPSIATTVEELKAFLANTPEQWYAPLQTPQTYQLTPQEITSLLGENNLWADTGDSEVEYRADTKMYIDNKIAELQALVLENNGGN